MNVALHESPLAGLWRSLESASPSRLPEPLRSLCLQGALALQDGILSSSEWTAQGKELVLASATEEMARWFADADIVTQASHRPGSSLEKPIFIAAFSRTGSTLLHNLMAVDPRNRPPRLWELWYPALVREGGASASRARRMAHTRLAQIRRTSPRLLDAHPMHEEAPEECAWMMWHNHTIAIRHLSYRYWEWFAGLNHQQTVVLYEAYVAHACRIMADGASAGRRWLGKGQAHVHYLPALLTCVPDARVICLHRDPGKMLPSLLSLYSTVLASPEVSPDYPRIADLLVQMFEHGAGMMMATDSRLDGRIMDIEFDELIADPHDVLRRIYERFSMEWSAELEAAVRRFMAERADDHRSRGSSVAVPWPATCRLRGEVFQRYSDWRAERRRQ